MKITVNTEFKGGMTFESSIGNHKIIIDSSEENGGNNNGPSPKPLLLSSLAGCTGMDIVSLLKKMRVKYDYFNILTEGLTADEHPKKYLEISVIYQLKGNDINYESVLKAVMLSKDKYCGVAASLKDSIKLIYIIEINGIRKQI